MTAFNSVAGGTAGGETSNEHGRTGRREQDRSKRGLRDTLEIRRLHLYW